MYDVLYFVRTMAQFYDKKGEVTPNNSLLRMQYNRVQHATLIDIFKTSQHDRTNVENGLSTCGFLFLVTLSLETRSRISYRSIRDWVNSLAM